MKQKLSLTYKFSRENTKTMVKSNTVKYGYMLDGARDESRFNDRENLESIKILRTQS